MLELSENTGNNIGLDLASVEKHHIQKVLQHTNGYKPEAARLLGIGLTTLYRKMEPMDYNVKHFVLVYLTGCLFRKLVFLCTFQNEKAKPISSILTLSYHLSGFS